MKTILYVNVILAIFLMSCGNGGQAEETLLTPNDTRVAGDLGDNLAVVDGTYKVTYAGGDLILAVKLSAISQPENMEFDEIRAEVLDETGMPVSGLGTFRISRGLWASSDDNAKVDEILENGAGEAAVQLLYSSWGGASTKEAMKLVKQGKSFQVHTDASQPVQAVQTTEAPASQSSVSTKKASTGDANWDKIIDDYEDFVDDYIKMLKKANEGDMSAMTEYISMLEKAETLSEKLEDASDDLSTSQMSRFIKIQEKITLAAMEMM